jgi:integrase/recombinase XerD
MISDHFELQWRLARMRSTCIGPHLDDFSTALTDAGYSHFTILGYLRAADHVGGWADRHRIALSTWDDQLLVRFARHLTRCRCIKRNKGVFGDAVAGVRLLLARLRARGVIAVATAVTRPPTYSAISAQFAEWTLQHRGVASSTSARYQRVLQPFLEVLGEDPKAYTVEAIRRFVIQRLGARGVQDQIEGVL